MKVKDQAVLQKIIFLATAMIEKVIDKLPEEQQMQAMRQMEIRFNAMSRMSISCGYPSVMPRINNPEMPAFAPMGVPTQGYVGIIQTTSGPCYVSPSGKITPIKSVSEIQQTTIQQATDAVNPHEKPDEENNFKEQQMVEVEDCLKRICEILDI